MTVKEAIERIKCIIKNNSFTRADKNSLKLAIDALEKQIPKKPLNGKCGILCPSCHRREYIVQRDALDTHCGFCGQAIDWRESE